MSQELAIIEDYKNGMSLGKITEKYSFNNWRKVEKILLDNNIEIRRKRKTFLYDDRLKELYNMGLSSSEISRRLNWPTMTTWESLKRLGLDCNRKTREYSARPMDNISLLLNKEYNFDILLDNNYLDPDWRVKYFLDERFFEKIDNEHKAYILGWLYTDGNIYKDCTRIELIDKEILEYMKYQFRYSGPITSYQPKKSNTSILYRLSINRYLFTNCLRKQGLYENKSLIISFPGYNIVPKELMKHFVRGCMDGDGTINCRNGRKKRWTIGFVGTKNMGEGILNEFPLNVNWRQRNPNKNTWVWDVSDQIQVKNFIHYLYDDATIALKRKLIKVDQCLQYIYESELKRGLNA